MNRTFMWWALSISAVSLIVFSAVVFLQAPVSLGIEFEASLLFRSYPGLIVAMSAGFFGAAFSMLLQFQKRASEGTLEDLNGAASWHNLIVRGSVGLGAAAILYFFFRSGLLEGNLWPNLQALGYDTLNNTTSRLVPNQDWCLLVIWCFIAGFSETFVPNILSKTKDKSETS